MIASMTSASADAAIGHLEHAASLLLMSVPSSWVGASASAACGTRSALFAELQDLRVLICQLRVLLQDMESLSAAQWAEAW